MTDAERDPAADPRIDPVRLSRAGRAGYRRTNWGDLTPGSAEAAWEVIAGKLDGGMPAECVALYLEGMADGLTVAAGKDLDDDEAAELRALWRGVVNQVVAARAAGG